jgi:hypothetical protein
VVHDFRNDFDRQIWRGMLSSSLVQVGQYRRFSAIEKSGWKVIGMNVMMG